MKKTKIKFSKEKIKKHLDIKIKLREESPKDSIKKLDEKNNLILSEEIGSRKLSLEEIIPLIKENEIITERNTINTNQEIQQNKTNEPHIYDINNSIKESDYHRISEYQFSSGNYDMNQNNLTTFNTINSEENSLAQRDQNKSYELSREKELKDKRRRMW